MANEEQVSILKMGVQVWNIWRKKNPNVKLDLSHADFTEAKLIRADLGGADIRRANLSKTDFTGANLSEANLSETKLTDVILRGAKLNRSILWEAELIGADLRVADLWQADLLGANLGDANLVEANLRGAHLGNVKLNNANLKETNFAIADLTGAILSGANLGGANLTGAILSGANLDGASLDKTHLSNVDLSNADLTGADLGHAEISGATLIGSNFLKARLGGTILRNLDLSTSIGLDDVVHIGPSSISTDTFARSKGNIPNIFLRGCGLSDWEAEEVKLYNPDLSNEEINNIQYKVYDLRATQALQISPLFVSYSHADSEFVDRVGQRLAKKGVRYWRDIHDMKSGRMEKQIGLAIRQNPTVLLILSSISVKSDWVEHEVRTARELERELGRDVLCPVALDDSWKSTLWPKRIMEQIMEYNILDFYGWQDDSKFEGMFRKLIDGLELFYKG